MIDQQKVQDLFDYKDGKLYWKVKPNRGVNIGDEAGYLHNTKSGHVYKRIGLYGKYYLTHRLIFLYHTGHMPDIVDHKDGDTLNNTISNLRAASDAKNNQNAKLRKDNTSGFKGVYWNKQNKNWNAKLGVEKRYIFLGAFDNKKDAIQAVKKARKENHGEFARSE